MIESETEQGTGRGYTAVPVSGSGPGVLVLHAWWGLTPFFTGLCDRLAEAGFVVLAPDLFDGRTASTVPEAEALMKEHDSERIQTLALAAVDKLRAHPAVRGSTLGVVGFSFGAAWGILLSTLRPEDIAAVVVFYGAYPVDFAGARAAYLGHFAETDEWEPMEGVREMEAAMVAAGRDVTLHTYPEAGHWFFESNRPESYLPSAAQLAWERTVEFLRRYL